MNNDSKDSRKRKKRTQKPVRSSRPDHPTPGQNAGLGPSLSLPIGVAEADPTPADMLLDPSDSLTWDPAPATSFMPPPTDMPQPANDPGDPDLSYWNADGEHFAREAERYMWLAVDAAEARWAALEKRILRDVLLKTIDGDKRP